MTHRRGKKPTLTYQDVAEIKYLLSMSTPYRDICRAYKCNSGVVSKIKHNQIWKDVVPVGEEK